MERKTVSENFVGERKTTKVWEWGRVAGSFGIFADVVNRDGSSRLFTATLTPLI